MERIPKEPSPLFGICPRAFELAKKYHPQWKALSQAGQKLMARNGYQVLGPELDSPAKFIVCWTENGELKGGTSQALRIAKDWNNLWFEDAIRKLEDFVGFTVL